MAPGQAGARVCCFFLLDAPYLSGSALLNHSLLYISLSGEELLNGPELK